MTTKEQLTGALRDATSNGLFPLVAYSIQGEKIGFLTTTIGELPRAIEILEAVTKTEYNLGRYIHERSVRYLAEQNPHLLKSAFHDIVGLGSLRPAEIGAHASSFGAPYYRNRASALVDITGFSRKQAPDQLAHLYSLDRIFVQQRWRLKRFCDQLGVDNHFGRSSTGDGYYIWSSRVGGNADVSLFMFLICMLEAAENIRLAGEYLKLKGVYFIGDAYMIYDTSSGNTGYPEPVTAVGPATNGAARLMGKARPRQLLVNDFRRSGQRGETLTPEALVQQANELFRQEGKGAALLRMSPKERLRVVDKHGETWYCWNVFGELPGDGGRDGERVGLQADDARNIEDLSFRP